SVEGVNIAPIPTYLTDTTFMNVEHKAQPKGTMTRLYRESSFDSLRIIGDFMVINIKESRVLNDYPKFDYYNILNYSLRLINSCGGLRTLYGHDSISEYVYIAPDTIFYIQSFIRNITDTCGGLNKGSGIGSSGFSVINLSNFIINGYPIIINRQKYDTILIGNRYCYMSRKGTCQCIGGGNLAANPTGIVCHEIAHSLFGDNPFHTSGGNHRFFLDDSDMPFLTVQGGYGLMGAANSSLVCCNGYERWRMHWKHPQAPDYITARDENNSVCCISDISKADGNLTFYLRDFITYGDVVRIRLPYKDSSVCSNQYIWLENHQVGYNNKLDFLQHSNTAACRPQGAAGIYAYYQIGRDVLSGNRDTVYFENERDNLKMIPAEGYYNYSLHHLPEEEKYNLRCINWNSWDYFHKREAANPFNGYQDQEIQFNPDEYENKLDTHNIYPMWRKVIGSDSNDHLPFLGDELDAFTGHVKIGMATNPSSCNAKVFYNYLKTTGTNNYLDNIKNPRNVRSTYLTGLSIEMIPQANHDFIVHVRWDDYDITQQANWTGRIVLKEQAHLLRGSRITLTQNLTPEQPFRDVVSGQFAPTTRMLCEQGSLLTLQSNAVIELEKKSRLMLERGSRLTLSDTAVIRIGAGCTMEAEADATIRMGGQSRILVDSGGVLLLKDSVLFSDSARIVVRPGGQLITEAALPISQDSLHFLFPPSTCLMRNEAAPAEDSLPQKRRYESFFGKEYTFYGLGYVPVMYITDIDTDAVYGRVGFGFVITADTVNIGNHSYYYEHESLHYSKGQRGYYREDTLTGCLYELVCGEDTTEHILCNMSLNIGDTFRFPSYRDNSAYPNYSEDKIYYVADSVFYMQGYKIIRLKHYWFYNYFIEGVGCVRSPFCYIHNYEFYSCNEVLPVVGCVYKDDSLVYLANERVGCSFIPPISVSKYTSDNLHVYPNPAQEFLQVKSEDMADSDGEIIIVNALGMVMHRGSLSNGESRISLHGWASGVYTMLYRSQKGVQQVRFVKE
ncbi:MAG: T9SS type A sorting domain-containing protein, partial [Bacteroidales bacterium]|nr:T9SS type A sorting domain-containing protein [Bacteroidales bacterium]